MPVTRSELVALLEKDRPGFWRLRFSRRACVGVCAPSSAAASQMFCSAVVRQELQEEVLPFTYSSTSGCVTVPLLGVYLPRTSYGESWHW